MDYEQGKKLDKIIELLQAILARKVDIEDDNYDEEEDDNYDEEDDDNFQEEEVDPEYVKHIEEEFPNYDDTDKEDEIQEADYTDEEDEIEEEDFIEEEVPFANDDLGTAKPLMRKEKPKKKNINEMTKEERIRQNEEGMF